MSSIENIQKVKQTQNCS